MITVRLSMKEMILAAAGGAARQVENIYDDKKNKAGKPTHGDWQDHIEGFAREMAFAKYYGVYCTPGERGQVDFDFGGYRWQVKGAHDHYRNLLLKPEDNDLGARYVLVTGHNGDYRIQGWALCSVVKMKDNLHKGKDGRADYYRLPNKEKLEDMPCVTISVDS